ncbi:MAG: recombinase family protein [Lachnospiraceae bacterium]|nr:recombinase family protein [Lachnospiraceae bacterium]
MARKSRKNMITTTPNEKEGYYEQINIKNRIPTAIYVRLSNENNGQKDDDSIKSQFNLVKEYINEHPEYEIIDTYIDNGYTGTNFDRPEFERMMADVNHGRINCIVVKDLSRFGRNYVETGFYIENIFPKLGVKLISVNDNFDSSKEVDRQSVTIPLKNMINEMYARDMSRKISIAHKMRMMKRDGKVIGSTPYGYIKNDEGNFLLVDDVKSKYVKVIFQWALMGESLEEITRRLNLIDAPSPGRSKNAKNNKSWNSESVGAILQNPIYTGDKCYGRVRNSKLNNSKDIQVPKEEWAIHKNTHEPLVTRTDYWNLDQKRESKKKSIRKVRDSNKKLREQNKADFAGLVYCLDCKKKLKSERKIYNAGEKYAHINYICRTDKTKRTSCNNIVSNDFIKVLVMEQLKMHLKLLTNKYEAIKSLKEMDEGKDIQLSVDMKIKSCFLKLSEQKKKLAKLYEDFNNGILDKSDYSIIREKQIDIIQNLEEKYKNLNAQKDNYIRIIDNFISIIDGIQENPADDGFDENLVREFVEKIYVGKGNRVEIVFKYKDIIDLITEALESDAN